MIMENVIWIIVALICLSIGVLCLLKPEKFKWMPVYKFYARIAGEKTALLIVRLSAGLGFIALSVILFLYVFGVVG